MYIPLLLLSVLLPVYIVFYFKFDKKRVLVLKMLTSTTFLALGIIASNITTNRDYAILVMCGLCFGFIGDFLLGMQRVDRKHKKIYFLFGLLAFLIGHCFYISAFSLESHIYAWVYLTVPVLMTLVGIFLLSRVNIKSLAIKCGNYLYLFITAMLLTFGVGNLILDSSFLTLVCALGAIFFALSDLLLFFLYFKNPKSRIKMLKTFNIVLYYSAQILLAYSIYLS
ncbi:MAG: hypothetical protein GX661_04005 [Acholeplasmataceae bacterium]|nr:hypothetical protein [Acholeplasmataceae bacterium]